MPKVKEYHVIGSSPPARFEELVAEFISKGWQPLGGVSADKEIWLQAMVKYAE